MPIVGGLDIHRKQLTFDYLDTVTGEVKRGQVAPADRVHLRAWLARFAGRDDVAFALEGCTGWRYVAEELAGAGVAAHVAEPADTAFARGRKRHAKTDKTDSRHLRELLAEGRLPECWVPPSHILECRALLETYHDLRAEHTAWVQRIHAVFFHQGAPALGDGALRTDRDLQALRAAAAAHLSPAGQLQVATALDMLAALEARLDVLRHRLLAAARSLTGAKVLAERLYGVGPVTGLAMTCWLGGAGRFSSSRKAVRFAGLDVTVWSSDRKGPPGRLGPGGTQAAARTPVGAGLDDSARTGMLTSAGTGSAAGPACLPRPARRGCAMPDWSSLGGARLAVADRCASQPGHVPLRPSLSLAHTTRPVRPPSRSSTPQSSSPHRVCTTSRPCGRPSPGRASQGPPASSHSIQMYSAWTVTRRTNFPSSLDRLCKTELVVSSEQISSVSSLAASPIRKPSTACRASRTWHGRAG